MLMRKLTGRNARLALCLAIAASVIGCAPRITYVKRAFEPPPAVYCNDVMGHKSGAKPWVLGGTCCCTPTRDLFATYQKDEVVTSDMTYETFLAQFSEKGIKTDLDHKGCNNRCSDGPHVVFGGHCMATPTPGTANCEQVTQGVKPEPVVEKSKKGR